MDEDQIAAEVKQNASPQEYVHTPAPEPTPDPQGQARTTEDYGMDEMTLFKLKAYFGDRRPDKVQLNYVYSQIAGEVGTDYFAIMDRIREIEGLVTVRHNESRIFKVYSFLKLDTIRKQTEKEMSYLRDA